MTANPFAGAGRIGWMEFWTHLKSPRLIVIVVLLALLIFAVSYGLSQSASPGLGNYMSVAAYGAVRNEGGTNHYVVVGWLADQRGLPKADASLAIYVQDYTLPPVNQTGTYVTTVTTNTSGFAEYDTGTILQENKTYAMRYGEMGIGTASFYPRPGATFSFGRFTYGYSSGPYGTDSSYTFQVMTTDGYPASGADIYFDGNLTGHPDANGFYMGKLAAGTHTLNVTYEGYSESQTLQGYSSGPAYENGADAVLVGLVGTFMGLILPIMAIAVSFDAIARERAQGSLEVLLARRVRREGVVLGKFLGAFTAIAVPVVGVLLAGIAAVTSMSGRAPTTVFAVAVFGASLFLVAVYVLLMLLFSTLAKSVGTAVVFGVVTWLFFNLLFSFVTTFLMLSMGGFYYSSEFYTTLLTAYLLDPNMIYQMIMGATIPMTGGSGFGYGLVIPTGYLELSTILIAAGVWIVVPLVITMYVFRKKAES